MADSRIAIALSFFAGIAVGVAGTLVTVRREPAPIPAVSNPGTTTEPKVANPLADPPSEAPPTAAAAVFINEKQVAQAQLDELRQAYGAAPPPGHYWYDPRSGLYGNWGFEAAGYIKPGHNFGPVPTEASHGNTGVFINGRQINLTEAQFFQRLFGAVYQGQWWLDGTNGNIGLEGNSTPVANIVLAMQQASRSGGDGGGYRWRDNINNSSGGAENGCVWVNSPGSTYSSSGCN